MSLYPLERRLDPEDRPCCYECGKHFNLSEKELEKEYEDSDDDVLYHCPDCSRRDSRWD